MAADNVLAKQIDPAAEVRQLVEDFRREQEQVEKDIKEIEMLLRQSSNEVEKQAQRNTQIANRLRIMESHLDSVPRQDIKENYTSAQESQRRLFTMRSQVEQLQSKQQFLKNFNNLLQHSIDVLGNFFPTKMEIAAAKPAPTAQTGIMSIINAQENERQHLARQMHDGPAQSLTNLILQAEICERLFDIDPLRARTELGELKQSVTQTFTRVREFIFNLRPMMLDDLGLVPTIKRYVKDFEEKNSVPCSLSITGLDQRLPPALEVTLFRIIQNLLNNVREHAQASRVQVLLTASGERIIASVEDDGSGFDVEEVLAMARDRKKMGIAMMQEQIEMLGGDINIESEQGKGTKVTVSLPVYISS